MAHSISPSIFWAALKTRGYTFFAGVPDSTFGSAYEVLLEDKDFHYVPAVREDVALGIVSAAYFAGDRGAVVLQNSGLGNLVNPLTSFSLMYHIPVLLIVGWRGYGGAPNDAPEHWIMGEKTPDILSMLGVPFEVLEPDNLELSLDRLTSKMDDRAVPAALLVRHGVIE